jgi:hypothetical protein
MFLPLETWMTLVCEIFYFIPRILGTLLILHWQWSGKTGTHAYWWDYNFVQLAVVVKIPPGCSLKQ